MLRSSLIFVILIFAVSAVSSFSAHLSRPWEAQPPNSSLLTSQKRRKPRWTESSLTSQTDDREETTMRDSASSGADQDAPDDVGISLPDAATSSSERNFADSSSAASFSPTTPSSQPLVEIPTVWSCRQLLWKMCRPSNFPGVILFHVIAVHLALKYIKTGASLLATLMRPTVLVTLFCVILNSSSSMVINDYYDKQLGVDAHKLHKPLVGGAVPMPVARRFLNYLYATLLLCSTIVPGIPTRLSVMIGAMSTFWYTKHLKPITWIKNAVCAGLIALSPLTSGSAVYNLAGRSGWGVLVTPSLMGMSGILFSGFLGREILMDINDSADDERNRVQTVPVRYGRRFASRVALACTAVAGTIAVGAPLSSMVSSLLQGSDQVGILRTSLQWDVVRSLVLASVGSVAMVYRAWQVSQAGGEDRDAVDRAVEEGKLTVVLILASFL